MKGTISVNYYTEDGSAKAGLHYESIAGEATMCHGRELSDLSDITKTKAWLCQIFRKESLGCAM
jgi:hypothetical protein